MSEVAINVENLSKLYQIGAKKSGTLRDTLANSLNNLFNFHKKENQTFWALKDIEFKIDYGEAVGIIGKNGAGKSTLLKILSRITQPTTGKIEILGRISSLLEVGTGFHADLSGRENIFLNGTILGMSRQEIKSKLDEIISFSGIEKFIDTPVKHYSSGMYVRLAFAVAAHLEPEILIVDEVLAVGDAEFQKKCLGKMKEVTGQGRTVVFVSHNMTAVTSFCSRGIYLKSGKVQSVGPVHQVVDTYLGSEHINVMKADQQTYDLPGDEIAQLISARLIDASGTDVSTIFLDTKIGIEMEYEILKKEAKPIPNIHVTNSSGDYVFVSATNSNSDLYEIGLHKAIVWIPSNLLNEGSYNIGIAVSTMSPVTVHFYAPGLLSFEIIENINNREIEYTQKFPGLVRPQLEWEHYIPSKA
jgi:lipopolysaccharide transport system ATP-binding protein